MSSAEIFIFLNSFFATLAPVVRLHSGFIDKYTGDGFMAIFPNSPADAIRAAVQIQRRLQELNRERWTNRQEPIRAGIGINSGSVTLGTVGYKDQMQNTVISDAVNVSARLETETKNWGCRILVSLKTLADSELKDSIDCRLIGRVNLKGKEKPVFAYEVYEDLSEQERKQINSSKMDFEYAVQLFEAGEVEKARGIFDSIVRQNPSDPVVANYIRKFTGAAQAPFTGKKDTKSNS